MSQAAPQNALIFAYRDMLDGADPLALSLIGGESILHRQVMTLHHLGVERIFLYTEQMTPGLRDFVQRWSPQIILVRGADDLARCADHVDMFLLVEEGVIASPSCFAASIAHQGPSLTVWPMARPNAERIAEETHWAGIACLPGSFIAGIARELGDWDLQSTLLRAAAADPRTAHLPLLTHGDDAKIFWHLPRTEDQKKAVTRSLSGQAAKHALEKSLFVCPLFLHRALASFLDWLLSFSCPPAISAYLPALIPALLFLAGAGSVAGGFLWAGVILLALFVILDPICAGWLFMQDRGAWWRSGYGQDNWVPPPVFWGMALYYAGLAVHFMSVLSGLAAFVLGLSLVASWSYMRVGRPLVSQGKQWGRAALYFALSHPHAICVAVLAAFGAGGQWEWGLVALCAGTSLLMTLSQMLLGARLFEKSPRV